MNVYQKYKLLKLSFKYKEITYKKIGHFLNNKLCHVHIFPKLLRFFLFYGCNLKCKMCGQWGENGTSKTEEIKNFISIEKLYELIDEAVKYRPEIYIWGGEPTLHPDFDKFISYIKQKRLVCTINTNGILLEKYSHVILESNVDSLDISLLGTKKIHDEIVQVPGSYEKIMRGLNLLQMDSHKNKPLIKAIITLSNNNLRDIENLLNENEKNIAIDMSILQLPWFTTQRSGELYQKRMRKEFNIEADRWHGFQNDNAEKIAEEVENLIKKISKGKNFKKAILLFPNIQVKDIRNYFLNHSDMLGYKKCGALHRELDIRPNGDVVVCADFPDFIVGNVNNQTIQKIWQGGEINKFRKSVLKNGLLPICSRCCGLFR